MGLGPQTWKEMRGSLQRILSSNEVRLSLFSGTNNNYFLLSCAKYVLFSLCQMCDNAQKGAFLWQSDIIFLDLPWEGWIGSWIGGFGWKNYSDLGFWGHILRIDGFWTLGGSRISSVLQRGLWILFVLRRRLRKLNWRSISILFCLTIDY